MLPWQCCRDIVGSHRKVVRLGGCRRERVGMAGRAGLPAGTGSGNRGSSHGGSTPKSVPPCCPLLTLVSEVGRRIWSLRSAAGLGL